MQTIFQHGHDGKRGEAVVLALCVAMFALASPSGAVASEATTTGEATGAGASRDRGGATVHHRAIRAPGKKRFYDGIVTLNEGGEATIRLRGHFFWIDPDYRVLGTAIGKPMPELHASIDERSEWFGLWRALVVKIRGGAPGGRVSWQVTDASKTNN